VILNESQATASHGWIIGVAQRAHH